MHTNEQMTTSRVLSYELCYDYGSLWPCAGRPAGPAHFVTVVQGYQRKGGRQRKQLWLSVIRIRDRRALTS